MLISVIVLTYNQASDLMLILDSFLYQSDQDFELIITEDGQGQETKDLIEQYKKKFSCRFIHVWQPDLGHRAAAARNLGAKQAQGEYLIFLDGDCVPSSDFIFRHRCLAQQGWFVRGSRIKLIDSFAEVIKSEHLPIFKYSIFQWVGLWLAGNVRRISPLLRLPDGFFRRLRAKQWRGATSFNLAFYREDFYAVGGFDESFEERGYEDSDLVVRMLNHGIQRKDGNYSIAVFHLGDDKGGCLSEKNYQLLQRTIQQKRVQAQCGISRH